MKSKKNTLVSRAAVGCVTTAIFLLLCIIKGIYPFGIATLDTVDFQSQWIPACTETAAPFLTGESAAGIILRE